MKATAGQALVELAVCMPVVLLLGLGVAAVVEVADGSAGLNAATQAAVAAAARAPNAASAHQAALARFDAVIAFYPVRAPDLQLDDGGFGRGSTLRATATGYVDLGWEAMAIVPARVDLVATSSAAVEPWRSR